jgi:uncharacterized protein (DUF1697 family)
VLKEYIRLEINVTYVALLRGINVGGKNLAPMKDLARLFADAGCGDVRTYIQSGNVIFRASGGVASITDKIVSDIEKRFGFRVPLILRTSQQLIETIRENPFIRPGVDQKALHVYFLAGSPQAAAIAGLDAKRSLPDAFHVRGQEIYLHLPNGMGRTKLTNAYFDSKLATTCTARNWATVLKLSEMMAARMLA